MLGYADKLELLDLTDTDMEQALNEYSKTHNQLDVLSSYPTMDSYFEAISSEPGVAIMACDGIGYSGGGHVIARIDTMEIPYYEHLKQQSLEHQGSLNAIEENQVDTYKKVPLGAVMLAKVSLSLDFYPKYIQMFSDKTKKISSKEALEKSSSSINLAREYLEKLVLNNLIYKKLNTPGFLEKSADFIIEKYYSKFLEKLESLRSQYPNELSVVYGDSFVYGELINYKTINHGDEGYHEKIDEMTKAFLSNPTLLNNVDSDLGVYEVMNGLAVYQQLKQGNQDVVLRGLGIIGFDKSLERKKALNTMMTKMSLAEIINTQSLSPDEAYMVYSEKGLSNEATQFYRTGFNHIEASLMNIVAGNITNQITRTKIDGIVAESNQRENARIAELSAQREQESTSLTTTPVELEQNIVPSMEQPVYGKRVARLIESGQITPEMIANQYEQAQTAIEPEGRRR